MPHLIEVEFKGNRREFFFWDGDELPPIQAGVIVDADRGEDLGRVRATGAFAQKRYAGVPHGLVAGAAEKRALRLATVDDLRRASENYAQNEDARRRATERVRAHQLVMKVTDAEWQWDRKKLTFYFTAEKRVDFRQLVRDLAAMFRARIELKQIGVRDEAKRLDGIGRCGRQYCSASWLPELRPVNLGVAKDQRLSLNPSQISGACGRLMCSLRYEHDFYVQSRKRFPKEGRILVTRRGEEKVVANDIFHDRVTLRTAEGDVRVVTLADFKQELAEASEGAPVHEAADDPPAAEAASVEAVLAAAALADGEVPVRLGFEDREPHPARPLREPDRRADRQANDSAPAPAAPAAAEESVVLPAVAADAPPSAVRPSLSVAEPQEARVEAGAETGGDTEQSTASEPSAAGAEPAPGEAEDRRPRRRRGRRGGRRGRGGTSQSGASDSARSSDGE